MSRYPFIDRLICLAVLLLMVILGVSGFLPLAQPGARIEGYWLLTHVVAAGAFAAAFLAMAFMRAQRHSASVAASGGWIRAAAFWGLVISVILLIASADLQMTPVPDTRGELLLTRIHIVAAISAVIWGVLYLVIRPRHA